MMMMMMQDDDQPGIPPVGYFLDFDLNKRINMKLDSRSSKKNRNAEM